MPDASSPAALPCETPRLLAAHGAWEFFYKPAAMHTVQGRSSPSLEALLPELTPQPVLLCNRLDFGTSGIVAAARSAEAVQDWRHTEDAGLCEKRYVALLCGHMARPLTAVNALDTRKRITSKVLRDTAPPLRHTRFEPLGLTTAGELAEAMTPHMDAHFFSAAPHTPLTLAACAIRKGARHQIRAHAAHAGHALWGDGQYGGEGREYFLLHHGALRMPGAGVHCSCFWLEALPEPLRRAARHWLELSA